MDLSRSQKISYSIVAVLAAVFLLVLVYLQVQRGNEQVPKAAEPVAVGGLSPEAAAKAFDVGILSDSRYKALDASLFDAGRVPVPVPQSRGKPNLF